MANDELYRALRNADAAGDTAAAARIAAYIRQSANAPKQVEYDPTEGMSTSEKFLAGMGKSFTDLGRGAGQYMGLVDREDVAQSRKRDEALMKTGAGGAGAFTGAVLPAIATAFIPGVNTYTGAAAVGSVMGALQPSVSNSETVKNIWQGGLTGVVGQGVGNLFGGLLNSGKAALEPFSRGGQDKIMGRVLNNTAGGEAAAVKKQLLDAGELIPGSQPTVAQAAPQLAPLERSLTAADPAVNVAFQRRMIDQNDARRAALDKFADPEKREFFSASRDTAAKQLYDQAFSEAPVVSPWIKGQFTQLEKRPAFNDALRGAQTRAANEGVALNPENQTQLGHYAKMELDAMINQGKRAGDNVSGLIDTRNKLVSIIESKDFSPSYREARSTYSAMSKPLNEIDTVQAIRDSSFGKLQDNFRPEAFARALNDQTARKATGYSGATLDNVLSPEAAGMLKSLKLDAVRSVQAQNAGRGSGSDTAQKLAYANIVDAAGFPTWLRDFGMAQKAGNIMGRVGDVLYKGKNEELNNRLAAMMLNPNEAGRILSLGRAQPWDGSPQVTNSLRTLMLAIENANR